MQDVIFPIACVEAELPAVQLDTGSWIFHAHSVCAFADLAHKGNVARWIKDNIPKKWIVEFKRPGEKGRPALYLTLPGFLFSLSQGNSEVALSFRDEVYEEIIPEIIQKGGYIAPTASNEQLEVFQQKIIALQQERKVLRSWSPYMPMCKIRFLTIINYKGSEYSPFLKEGGLKPIEFQTEGEFEAHQKEMRDQKMFLDLVDTLFTGKKMDLWLYGFEEEDFDKAFEQFQEKLPQKLYRVLINPYQDFSKHQHPKPSEDYLDFQFSVELKHDYGDVWLEYVPEKEKQLKNFLMQSDTELVG